MAASTARKRKRPGSAGPEQNPASDLIAEIAMLRTLMDEVRGLAWEDLSLSDLLKVLDGLGRTSTRLAALLKAQRELAGEQQAGSALNQAMDEVLRELSERD